MFHDIFAKPYKCCFFFNIIFVYANKYFKTEITYRSCVKSSKSYVFKDIKIIVLETRRVDCNVNYNNTQKNFSFIRMAVYCMSPFEMSHSANCWGLAGVVLQVNVYNYMMTFRDVVQVVFFPHRS